MGLKKYTEDVLIVLEKNTELEQLMTNLAEDSALTPAKAAIQDIQKRVVKDRIIELTEQYFGKAIVDDHVGRSRWAFIKGIGTTTSPEAVRGKEEKIEKTETKIAKVEAKREAKLAKVEAKREAKRKKLEEELAQVNRNE